MFGTGNLLELKRFLSGLDYITGKIKENWGDLKRYEDSLFEWLQDPQYMGGFYDYLRGDHDALLLCEVINLVVKLETFFKDGKNYADIDTWELKDDVKGKIRLSYHELADYLGLWRTIIHKYAGTGGKPQPEQRQAAPEPQLIPEELETPEAKEYFDKAIKLGLMDANYKWLKGLQMLACFSRDMSLKLGLGKGVNSDGSPRISWKPFETLFKIGHGKLRNNYNDIQKTGEQPRDAYLIDKVFE